MPKVTQVLEQSSGTRQVCSIGLVPFLVIVYSYFEKVCREKCTRQSWKALWVVLSSLFFKEILLTTFAAQNKCNIHYKTAPRYNITNEGTRASNVTIASFYISCQIFRNKHAVLCITMINMLYINLSFLFLYAQNKSKRTLNVTFLRQNCKNNRLQFMK